MKIYYWMKHPEEYDEVEETNANVLGLEPKSTATKEAIHDLYHFLVIQQDNDISYNAKEISKRMIDKFKMSKCYQVKSDDERQEIIKYLVDNPDPENPLIDY